jgi:hemoglobin/transferrin/lactoferrin receptor protein
VWLTANTTEGEASALALDDLDLSNQALTGSAGLLYSPGAKSQWKISLSSGFRSPNIDDIGKVFELDDNLIVVPNPDLAPEYVYSGDLSYRQQIGESFQLELVGYYSILTNAIVRDEFTINGSNTITIDGRQREIRAQVNAERAYLYGGTARLKAKLSNTLAFTSVFSINEGFEDGSREPLRHITPKFGQTVLGYQGDRLTADLISNYHLTLDAGDIRDTEIIDKAYLYTEEGTPGWFTLDLRTGYRFSNSFDLEAGVENIFDQHYRTYSSGISAPGRNIYLTGKVTF